MGICEHKLEGFCILDEKENVYRFSGKCVKCGKECEAELENLKWVE